MQSSLLQNIFFWSLGLLLTLGVKAHTVDQFYMELVAGETGFKTVIFADAAYCLPEYRGDDDKPAPSRDWLVKRTEAEHINLRKEAEFFIRQALGFMLDEKPVEYEVSFPDYDSTPYDFYESPMQKAMLRIELNGNYLPEGGSLQVWWKDDYKANLLVNVSREDAGDDSSNLMQVDWVEGGNAMDLGVMVYPFEAEEVAQVEVEKRNSWFTFVKVGWDHIVGFESNFSPKGLDHILFVVGLFLFSPTWKPLLHQSLAFTVSHSITLALSLMGVIVFAGKWVEVLIALSIVYIAIENLWLKELQKHRILVVFGFGLLHGFGFGSVLQEFLPTGNLFFPLVGFNLGVELGQVVILVVCFLLCWKFLERFNWIRIVGSSLIASIASFWVVERILS